MVAAVDSGRAVVRWYENEFDVDRVVREELREIFGMQDAVVGRLCARCGSSGHGRPWARVGSDRVHVSWSRAEGRLVTAVSLSRPVGVDVESLHVARSAWPLADSLATGEVVGSALEFARLWVAKEAILKARGVGLTESMSDLRLADFEGDLVELDAPDGLVGALATL